MRFRVLAGILALFFGLVTVSPVLAAGGLYGNLRGSVKDAKTGAPIAGAAVVAKAGSGVYSAKTDASGTYSIIGMNADTYTVSVTAAGYTTENVTGVTVFGDETDLANVTLNKELQTIARVVSTAANSAYQPTQTIDSYTVSGQRITQALGNPYSTNESDLIQSAPGVIQTYDVGSGMMNGQGISIRGSLNVELGYQYDGVPFTAPFFDENASQGFLNGLIGGTGGSLQVVSGAGDATQGNVGGGIINTVVPRGVYPGEFNGDAEVGGPWYNHTFNGNYSYSTPNGRISDYASFSASSFVPDQGPIGIDSSLILTPATNNFYGTSYERHNDFVNNFVFRFGRNNNQSLQFLYRTAFIQQWGNLGGVPAGTDQFPNDATFLGSFAPSFYTTNAGLLALIPTLPYDTNQSSVSTAQLSSSNPMSFVKVSYTNSINSSTFFSLSYYNWSLYQGGGNYTDYLTAGPFGTGYSVVGGSRTGGLFTLTHAFGDNNTLTLEGKYEGARPYWNGQLPGENVYALAVSNGNNYCAAGSTTCTPGAYLGSTGFGGPLSPASGDWAIPVGGTCPAPGPDGCWIYDHLPAGASMPQMPTFGIDYHNTLQQQYGVGLRDQWQPNDRLTFDVGARVDGENNMFGPTPFNGPGGTPSDVDPSSVSSTFTQPREFEPRLAISWRIDRNNSLRFSYGRSTLFFFGQTLGTPFNVTGISSTLASIPATTGSSPYCGSGWHGPGNGYTNESAGAGGWYSGSGNGYMFVCPNYEAEYAWFLDQNLDAPDLGGYGPPTYSNFDLAWSHLFTKGALRGWSSRITGYTRRGFNVEQNVLLLNGPPNPITGQSSASVFTTTPNGNEKTAGIEALLTTPDVRAGESGVSGFITFNYINELLNTPPVAGSSGLPILQGQLLATGEMFKAGFVPPVSAVMGATWHLKHGTRITPTLFVNGGYPFGVGQQSIGYVNGILTFLPETNYAGLPYAGPNGPLNAYNGSYFVDPQVPGSDLNPNIAGSRGYNEPAVAGLSNSPPQAYLNLNVEQDVGRFTVGVQVYNITNNKYGVPIVNTLYQAAGFGVSGPQTGQLSTSVQGVPGAGDTYYPGGGTLPFLNNYGLGTSWAVYLRVRM
ncbi:MAG TPA: carboxypeptidase regulatory-like domain-containing protein [Candidatus Aquilonibacter sp.]